MTDTALTTTENRPRPAMTVGGNVGALIPQDIEQAFRIAQALAHSGMAPNGFQTPEKCFVAIMAGAELGLPPFQSLQSFAIINGRPTIYGAALMAVIRTNGFKVREWFEGDGETLTAFCEVTRPDDGDKAEASYSVADAKTAKLWGKAGPWTTNPKRMLQWRARGFSFTDGAADVLKGLQIREVVQDDEPFIEEPKAREGTGLLGKLEATQTLATEGFGIRDVGEEAGEASPEAEAKPKKPRKKTVANEALDAIADAEPEIVAQVVEDHGRPDDYEGPDAGMHDTEIEDDEGVETTNDEAFASDIASDPENLPADAEVEETATQTPEPHASGPITGPAPADTLYFMADKEAFPSGRRVVFLNGQPEKEAIDDTPDVPTYTEHAPAKKASAPKQAEKPPETASEPATTAFDDGAEPSGPSAFDDFDAALKEARDGAEVVAAVEDLFGSGECGTVGLKRDARVKAWERVIELNADGAKIDPVSAPFLLAAFVSHSEDIETIEATLPLCRDQQWFIDGGEVMQTTMARFVMDRVTALKGG